MVLKSLKRRMTGPRVERRGDRADALREPVDEVRGLVGVPRGHRVDLPLHGGREGRVARQRQRVHADPAREDELHAREADAVARQQRLPERVLRVADVEQDLRARPRQRGGIDLLDVEAERARVDASGLAFGARERDRRRRPRAPRSRRSVPTTAGTPSSRATIAACDVRPPRSVTMPAAVFMTGSQSGSVISVTRISPGWNVAELSRVAHDADLARHDAVADRESFHERRGAILQLRRGGAWGARAGCAPSRAALAR